MDNKKLIESVYEHNTGIKNEICCIEEMSELTKVLTKAIRMSPKFNKEHLLEEVSHVMLMCGVIARAYDLKDEDILRIQEDAVMRMYKNK